MSNTICLRPTGVVRYRIFLSSLSLLVPAAACRAQAPPSHEQLVGIVRETAKFQVDYLSHKPMHFRYYVHRVDPKEDTLRDLIESTDGNVARLVLHNGKPLPPGEEDGERARLEKILRNGDFEKKQKEEQRTHGYGTELIEAMPDAMVYTLVPGQPQLEHIERRQLVLDFHPNPQYHPKSTVQGFLDGVVGRLWIDAADHHLVRIEAHAIHNLNLAWGILARVYEGGSVEYDQRRIAENQYAYTHIRMHLKLRELMLRTVPYNSDLTVSEIRPLPHPPSGPEAISSLLSTSLKPH